MAENQTPEPTAAPESMKKEMSPVQKLALAIHTEQVMYKDSEVSILSVERIREIINVYLPQLQEEKVKPTPTSYFIAAWSIIDGSYIGDVAVAEHFESLGIVPQTFANHKAACIGFCEKDQKRYGWSHRWMSGFGIGFVAKEWAICTTIGVSDEALALNPELNIAVPVGFECKTLEDCKKCAEAFAEAVS